MGIISLPIGSDDEYLAALQREGIPWNCPSNTEGRVHDLGYNFSFGILPWSVNCSARPRRWDMHTRRGRPPLGVVISIPFYLLAVIGLSQTRYLKAATIACGPVFLFLLWQAAFAIRLSFDILVYSFSACEVLEGTPCEDSGDEITFAVLWPIVALGTVAALTLVYSLRRRHSGQGQQ